MGASQSSRQTVEPVADDSYQRVPSRPTMVRRRHTGFFRHEDDAYQQLTQVDKFTDDQLLARFSEFCTGDELTWDGFMKLCKESKLQESETEMQRVFEQMTADG